MGIKRVYARNVALTGLSRSGTTLTCHLLNKLPNTLALNEPINRQRFAHFLPDHEAVADGYVKFFQQTRRMALKEGEVYSQHINGMIPANNFEQQKGTNGLRSRVVSRGRILVGKKLSLDFLLLIKDPPTFAAILPSIVARLPCYATIRNPLAVLASWNSVDSPLREGRFTGVELYDVSLSRELMTLRDRYDKQLRLLDWYFSRFERFLPSQNIIRYEEIVTTGGAALSVIVPAAADLNEPLESKNANPLYDRGEILSLGERLLESGGAYWRFYERAEVRELMERA